MLMLAVLKRVIGHLQSLGYGNKIPGLLYQRLFKTHVYLVVTGTKVFFVFEPS